MMRSRHVVRILGALAVVVGVLGFGTGSATAAGEIGLSTDGVHWSSTLPGPLFAPGFVWVPGDTKTATFYVRNQATDAAVLDLTMVTGPVETLIDTGDLTVGASVDGGPFTNASTAGSHLLVDQVPVAVGAVEKIDVRVTFDPAATNESQTRQLDLHFTVGLSQDTAVSPPTGGNGGNGGNGGSGGTVSGPGGTSGLPGTGTVITPGMLILAAALCACGLGLIGWARRSREPHERQNSHA